MAAHARRPSGARHAGSLSTSAARAEIEDLGRPASTMHTGPLARVARAVRVPLACLTIAVLLALAFAGAAVGSTEARAGWPKPAGGESASGAPEIIFTFDDGPHRKYTKSILDELERRGIKAIFFWVGHRVTRGGAVDDQIDLVHRAVREGHVIANHTINHANLCQVNRDEAAHEIDENARLYRELSGLPIILFRSPYGARCRQLVRMLEERQMQHLHWDIDPREWEHHSAERITEYIIRKLKRLEGRAVVLMHDTKAASARALPEVLDWIERENQRRLEQGRQPIRILTGSDLVAEHIDPALPDWLENTTEESVSTLTSTLGRLIP